MLKSFIAAIFALLAATFGIHHATVATSLSPTAQPAHTRPAQLAAAAETSPQTPTPTTPYIEDLSSSGSPAPSIPSSQRSSAPSTPASGVDTQVSAADTPNGSAALPLQQPTPTDLNSKLNALASVVGNIVSLLPSLHDSDQQQVAAAQESYDAAASPPLGGGAPNTIGAVNAIDQLTNVTVNGISGLTASEIPDLSGSYLPLSGGTVGNLTVSGSFSGNSLSLSSASSTNASSTNLYSTNAVFTNATSTNFFSTLGDFTTAIASTLTASMANITGLTATNSTTTSATTTSLFVKSQLSASAITAPNATIGALTATSTFAVSNTASFFGASSFGATATSTFGANGALSLASPLSVGSGGTGWTNITSGSILFGNGASALATSSNLFWDNTDGRLGIGTTSPTAILTLDSSSPNGTIMRVSNSSTGGHIYDWLSTGSGNTGGAGRLDLFDYTEGAARLSIASNGNVGIGTTTPGSIFSVAGVANWTTATSTYYSAGGINLGAGCFAIGGNCLGLGNIAGTLAVNQGGTGVANFGQGWIYTNGGAGTLAASTSPTVNYITATSTTATSTFAGNLSVQGNGLFSGKLTLPAGSSASPSLVLGNGGAGLYQPATGWLGANAPLLAPVSSTFYIFSMLNDSDTTGPKTYTSVDGINAAPFTAGNGADIYTDPKFRDPRLLKVGTTYYLSYTNNISNSPSDPTIGLATSSDLVHWTKVSTPNWSSLFTGSQASIWNGAWFQDPNSGNYYFYFATSDWATTVTPYVVQFFPATDTFGTPQAVTLSPTRVQSVIVAVWLNSGTYYALLQSSGSDNNEHNIEMLTASSPTGTWTIAGANNFAGWGNSIECGAEITTSAGLTRVYFCAFGGGAISYSQASSNFTTGSSWSAPVTLPTFQIANMDWVDIVPFSDSQTDQAVHALQGSGGSSNGLVPGTTPEFNLNSASGSYAGYNLYSNGTLYGVLGFQPSGPLDTYLYTANGALIDFGTNNTSRWRIGVNGGLYSTGATGGDEGAGTMNIGGPLDIAGTIVIDGSRDGSFANLTATGIAAIGTSTPYSRLEVWGPDTASTSAFAVVNNASTTEFAVYDTGNAVLSGGLTQNSDQRLKTNVQSLDASSSLAAIDALNPVSFDWINGIFGGGEQLGFIAQAVQQVFPQLVSTTSPTALTPNGTLGLNYTGLIAPIVGAIQALSTELASLESAVAGFAQSITTHQLNADEICLDGTCINQQQLAALLASQNEGSSGQGSSSSGDQATSSPDTPPVIQINGDNPAYVQVGATYQDLGATITGPQTDLNLGLTTYLNGTLTDPLTVDTTQPATDTIQYVATDQSGLAATTTRTVIIQAAANDGGTATTTP